MPNTKKSYIVSSILLLGLATNAVNTADVKHKEQKNAAMADTSFDIETTFFASMCLASTLVSLTTYQLFHQWSQSSKSLELLADIPIELLNDSSYIKSLLATGVGASIMVGKYFYGQGEQDHPYVTEILNTHKAVENLTDVGINKLTEEHKTHCFSLFSRCYNSLLLAFALEDQAERKMWTHQIIRTFSKLTSAYKFLGQHTGIKLNHTDEMIGLKGLIKDMLINLILVSSKKGSEVKFASYKASGSTIPEQMRLYCNEQDSKNLQNLLKIIYFNLSNVKEEPFPLVDNL